MTPHPDEPNYQQLVAEPGQLVVVDMGLPHSPTTITAWRADQGHWMANVPAGEVGVSQYDTVIGRDDPDQPVRSGITEPNVASDQLTLNEYPDGRLSVRLTGRSSQHFPVNARLIGPYPTAQQFHAGQAAAQQATRVHQARQDIQELDAADSSNHSHHS